MILTNQAWGVLSVYSLWHTIEKTYLDLDTSQVKYVYARQRYSYLQSLDPYPWPFVYWCTTLLNTWHTWVFILSYWVGECLSKPLWMCIRFLPHDFPSYGCQLARKRNLNHYILSSRQWGCTSLQMQIDLDCPLKKNDSKHFSFLLFPFFLFN